VFRSGDVLENPVTGERIVFRQTSRETNGELLEYEAHVKPHGVAAYKHLHPHQEERHEVLSGVLEMTVAGRKERLSPGDVMVVPAGVHHKASSDGEIHILSEFRPALRWEELFETWVGLARDGKINKRGYPNPLQAAVLAREYEEEVRAAWPPLPVQKVLVAMLAPVGKLFGYRAPYVARSGSS